MFPISNMDSERAKTCQLPEDFRKILTKQERLDVEFAQQLCISIFDARRRSHHLPHPRTGLIQAIIAFRL
jgi:hypothetical protein